MAEKKKRDYALEYERRRIRAKAQGFTSPTEKTKYNKAKAANEAFGKKLTVYNFRQKRAAEQKKAARAHKQAKLKFVGTPTTLRKWNISEKTFNRIRAENRKFDREKAWGKIAYKLEIDSDLNNYSDDRIGYILGYNQVFVHPKTKQLTGNARIRQVNAYEKLINKYELLNEEAEILSYRYSRELAA